MHEIVPVFVLFILIYKFHLDLESTSLKLYLKYIVQA